MGQFDETFPPILFEPHAWSEEAAREEIGRLTRMPELDEVQQALLAYLQEYFGDGEP